MNATHADSLVLGHFAVNHAPFVERCAAAASAGFTGISVWHDEIRELFATEGEATVRGLLDRHRLSVDHVELVTLPGPTDEADRARMHQSYIELALSFGARAVHAVALEREAPLADVISAYDALARRAADQGMLCGLEFVPVLTAVKDLASAREVFDQCSGSGGLLVLDSFHFFRCGAPWPLLEGLPRGSVVTVQLNDGYLPARTDDYGWEASGGRLLPGEGDFDLSRFIRVVNAARLPAPLTAEVMSDALDAREIQTVARATANATRAAIAAANTC